MLIFDKFTYQERMSQAEEELDVIESRSEIQYGISHVHSVLGRRYRGSNSPPSCLLSKLGIWEMA